MKNKIDDRINELKAKLKAKDEKFIKILDEILEKIGELFDEISIVRNEFDKE